MPQKLIRLTSETNDGIFSGKFDQDIHIKQNSEIALQSLSLERVQSSFTVNNSNNTMIFTSRENVTPQQTSNIGNALYQEDDKRALMKSIRDNLNAVCNMQTKPALMNCQWEAAIDETTDKVSISCRPSPFFSLAYFNPAFGRSAFTSWDQTSMIFANVPNFAPILTTADGIGRQNDPQSVDGKFNECFAFSQWPLIKSTGCIRVRLHSCTQGALNRPAFTIGVTSKKTKLSNATIELSDLDYAIQVSQNSNIATQGGYSYVNIPESTVVTPSNPFVKIEQEGDADLPNNDVFEIQIADGKLRGYIHQNAGGMTTLPASILDYKSGEDLFPVVFWHLSTTPGAAGISNSLDMIQGSLDPWAERNDIIYSKWQEILDQPANQAIEPQVSTLPSLIKYNPPGVVTNLYRPEFILGSDAIASYLGYTNKLLVTTPFAPNLIPTAVGADVIIPPVQTFVDLLTTTPYTRLQGFELKAKNEYSAAVDNDTYLIDTQTFLLDSYDSYGLSLGERNANAGGSRRNLLATIPVEDEPIPNSINSRVNYEPNTLDFIGIKNRSDIITRQIKMRLLNSRYNPVTTAGMAALTILIRDPVD